MPNTETKFEQVVPLEVVMRALKELRPLLTKAEYQRATGKVCGSCFTTTRTYYIKDQQP